jgi:hypothetical protein
VALLRRAKIIDQHIKIEDNNPAVLLSHSFTPVCPNSNYQPEYFESADPAGSQPSQNISDHIDWLT